MSHSTPVPDPITLRAARIASLALAANLILTGSSLSDPRQIETLVIDLTDIAGILAAQLAGDTESAVYSPTQGA